MTRNIIFKETAQFAKQARKLLSEDNLEDLRNELAKDPEKGKIMQGTGGFRKLRFARQGQGKSGGFRIVYIYINIDDVVILAHIYAKSSQEDLTKAQKNELHKFAKLLQQKG